VTYNTMQWNVAGQTEFSTTAGIDDNKSDAFGITAEFLFYDQDGHQLGKAVDVSQGHSQAVTLPLTRLTGLRVTCAARDTKNRQVSTYVEFGDAQLVHG
jgi:hypothetical protein